MYLVKNTVNGFVRQSSILCCALNFETELEEVTNTLVSDIYWTWQQTGRISTLIDQIIRARSSTG